MSVAIAVAAIVVAVLLTATAIADMFTSDSQGQAVTPEDCQQGPGPEVSPGRNPGPAGAAGDWLPFTPQPRTSPPQLRQPRICAGRLARVV